MTESIILSNNISQVVKLNIDKIGLDQTILRKISKQITLEDLDALVDPRDILQSKLFMHKLKEIMKDKANQLNRCIH